ncbi:MAG: phosphonate C-P lyase system protein PhnH [Desulfobacteraceae bacterium]|jgi:alpha-D-ribose 1-methylphosphonate 5-triphosphate synthase subunit PhnH|nr:phosphonate C-P lyase system protein PhnH [Desulfobacteraceae bacterium]
MDAEILKNQQNFRILLEAMSRPGRLVRLGGIEAAAPFAAILAVGGCLLDHEVSLCVIGGGNARALQAALVGATQGRPEVPEKADYLFIAGSRGQEAAARAKHGRLEAPEEGATLVYCLAGGAADASQRLQVRLRGPGIARPDGIPPEMPGVPPAEFQALMTVNADYPLGVDAFFVRPGGELMGLPRSTRIQVG